MLLDLAPLRGGRVLRHVLLLGQRQLVVGPHGRLQPGLEILVLAEVGPDLVIKGCKFITKLMLMLRRKEVLPNMEDSAAFLRDGSIQTNTSPEDPNYM